MPMIHKSFRSLKKKLIAMPENIIWFTEKHDGDDIKIIARHPSKEKAEEFATRLNGMHENIVHKVTYFVPDTESSQA